MEQGILDCNTTLSLLLPFVKISALQTVVPQNLVLTLPEITLGNALTAQQNMAVETNNSLSVMAIILLLGILVSSSLFLWKLIKISSLSRKGTLHKISHVKVITLPQSSDAFSFAGTIYLGENLNPENKSHIIAHELVHINQKHYIDLLYFEALRILFWFNPLIYYYQKQTAALHEYIADAEVILKTDKKSYYQDLLSQAFQTHAVSFINTFFNTSLIKNRIVMLHKSKSKKTQLAKFLMLLPLIAGIMLYTSCTQDVASETPQDTSITQKIEELKVAIENNKDGLTLQEHEELLKLARQSPLKGFDLYNALSLFEKGELEALPIAVIDQVPVYPGCENLTTNEERKACMSDQIGRFVNENFNTGILDGEGLKGRARISIQFKIDTQGNVVDILSRAPNNILEEEAKRVISLIPKMQPGKQDGNTVNVMYSLPIIFEVSE